MLGGLLVERSFPYGRRRQAPGQRAWGLGAWGLAAGLG